MFFLFFSRYDTIVFMEKRKDYATWDETFMSIAQIVSKRSKDPSTQVGACIVGKDNRVLSIGYNGAPNGFNDDKFPWGKGNKDEKKNKYNFVVHAERNAIDNFRGDNSHFKDAKLYVTHSPCRECAKGIIQIGIKEVIYLEQKYDEYTNIMFKECNVDMKSFIDVVAGKEYDKNISLENSDINKIDNSPKKINKGNKMLPLPVVSNKKEENEKDKNKKTNTIINKDYLDDILNILTKQTK